MALPSRHWDPALPPGLEAVLQLDIPWMEYCQDLVTVEEDGGVAQRGPELYEAAVRRRLQKSIAANPQAFAKTPQKNAQDAQVD